MQKQHLHIILLVFGCCFIGACGEQKFGKLNPYLHGEQALSFPIPDSVHAQMLISGWVFLPVTSHGSESGVIRIVTPDGRRLSLNWVKAGSEEPLLFSNPVRQMRGMTALHPALGLVCSLAVAEHGRSLTVSLQGITATELEARIGIDMAGTKARGLAALTEAWTESEGGADIALPWGDRWRLLADGEITPLPTSAQSMTASISFAALNRREYVLEWSALPSQRGRRGLDIDTESMSVDQALALLIASIPPVHSVVPTDYHELETAAELTAAQWLVHAEFAPNYISDLSVAEDQTFLLTYGLSAYRTLYAWGCLPLAEVISQEPLLDAAISRFDTTSREISRGASLETRLREATVWTFAEENLATDRPEVRRVYREQAHIALTEAKNDLQTRFRLWRREISERQRDTLALYELYIGGDSTFSHDDEPFIEPDSMSILNIAGHGNLSWLSTVNKEWLELPGLAWPLQMDKLRWQYASSIKFRVSDHWDTAQAALLDGEHPGLFSEEKFGAPPLASAAAELETVVWSYLGIQPRWRDRTITFDARLPANWGRTRARIPFEDGELYVDYDMANDQAWVAETGLTQTYTCEFYMPTPTGALSGQFKLAPGDSPRKVTTFVDGDNRRRLRFESESLPE